MRNEPAPVCFAQALPRPSVNPVLNPGKAPPRLPVAIALMFSPSFHVDTRSVCLMGHGTEALIMSRFATRYQVRVVGVCLHERGHVLALVSRCSVGPSQPIQRLYAGSARHPLPCEGLSVPRLFTLCNRARCRLVVAISTRADFSVCAGRGSGYLYACRTRGSQLFGYVSVAIHPSQHPQGVHIPLFHTR